VNCPLCDAEFRIPSGGFEALPSNFLIQQLLEVGGAATVSGRPHDVTGDVTAVDVQPTGCSVESDSSSPVFRELLAVCHNKLQLCLKENEDELNQLDADKSKFLKAVSVSEEMITKRRDEFKQLIELSTNRYLRNWRVSRIRDSAR